MDRTRVAASMVMDATPQRIYSILANYQRDHPRIVPKQYFKKIEVEEGGIGAGTRTRIEMRVMGSTRIFHHIISEPQPGRVLVEADVDGSSVTTFTVDPMDGGKSAKLTIETEFTTRTGVLGVLERFLTSMMMRRIYQKELVLIAEYAITPNPADH